MRLICLLSLYFFTLTILGCGSETDAPPAPGPQDRTAVSPEVVLVSNIDHLRLRALPGPEGEVLTTLSEGDTLFDLGEVSAFTTEVTLRGIRFNEPWIKVRTLDSLAGWVFAGGVNFQLDDRAALPHRLMQLRLQTFFGDSLARRALDYRQAFRSARSSEDLAAVFREAQHLRDTLVQLFDKRITLINSPGQIPNLQWMEEALPGMITQRVAEGTAFYLFFDFRQWQAKSRQTRGGEDDQFADICLTAYSLDSIEYFFPNWVIVVSDEGAHSELGKGLHLQMLKKLNEALATSSLFEPEYLQFKSDILHDILGGELGYWNDRETILQELDAIILAELGLLTPAEKESLKRRRQQFDIAGTDIRLNIRAGE